MISTPAYLQKFHGFNCKNFFCETPKYRCQIGEATTIINLVYTLFSVRVTLLGIIVHSP